jgi:CheY-like chemotaxis protein
VTADQWISLLRVLVWPILILFVVVRFGRPIGNFLTNIGELTLKAGGVEATAKRQEAAAALGAAIANREVVSPGSESHVDPAQAATVVDSAVPNARAYRRLHRSRVLWVDDRPDNNRYERQALEALGLDISVSTSTEDALAQLSARQFSLIISDMSRPPDSRAGYTLLDTLRARGDRTPLVIYAGSRAPEHVAEALQHGALGCTNDPSELVRLVTRALTRDG